PFTPYPPRRLPYAPKSKSPLVPGQDTPGTKGLAFVVPPCFAAASPRSASVAHATGSLSTTRTPAPVGPACAGLITGALPSCSGSRPGLLIGCRTGGPERAYAIRWGHLCHRRSAGSSGTSSASAAAPASHHPPALLARLAPTASLHRRCRPPMVLLPSIPPEAAGVNTFFRQGMLNLSPTGGGTSQVTSGKPNSSWRRTR